MGDDVQCVAAAEKKDRRLFSEVMDFVVLKFLRARPFCVVVVRPTKNRMKPIILIPNMTGDKRSPDAMTETQRSQKSGRRRRVN